MNALRGLSRWIDALNERMGSIACWLMLLLVLVGTYNTLARKAGKLVGQNLSSNFYIELQWYLFSMIFLLAGAYTLRHNQHVRVDVLYDRVSPRVRHWIDLVGAVLLLLPFCGYVGWLSVEPVLESWRIREVSPDPDGLPRYAIKVFIPLAFGLLFLQGVSQIARDVVALFGGGEIVPPDDSDPTEARL